MDVGMCVISTQSKTVGKGKNEGFEGAGKRPSKPALFMISHCRVTDAKNKIDNKI